MDHQYSSSSSSTSDFQASKVNTEGSVGALCELNSSDVAESSRTNQSKFKLTETSAPNINADQDAISVFAALKKNDIRAFADILCSRTFDQRMKIVAAYQTIFNKKLFDKVKSKVKGPLKQVLLGLLMPISEFYIRQLCWTVDGFFDNIAGNFFNLRSNSYDRNNRILIEILCAMSNHEIREITATFKSMANRELYSEFRWNEDSSFRKILTILVAGNRDESSTTVTSADLLAAEFDAEMMRKNFKKTVKKILCNKSFSQIKLISIEYQKLTGKTLEAVVRENYTDNVKNALVTIIRISNSPSEYYARRIKKAIDQFIYDDRSLGRLLVARYGTDLKDIQQDFERIFGKPLHRAIPKASDYRYVLLKMLGVN